MSAGGEGLDSSGEVVVTPEETQAVKNLQLSKTVDFLLKNDADIQEQVKLAKNAGMTSTEVSNAASALVSLLPEGERRSLGGVHIYYNDTLNPAMCRSGGLPSSSSTRCSSLT